MRATFEGPMRVQRRSLKLASAAARSYFETISAMTGLVGNSARGGRQFLDTTDSETDDGHRSRTLEEQRQRIQELRDRSDEHVGRENDRVAELLERQLELLERYQREIDRKR